MCKYILEERTKRIFRQCRQIRNCRLDTRLLHPEKERRTSRKQIKIKMDGDNTSNLTGLNPDSHQSTEFPVVNDDVKSAKIKRKVKEDSDDSSEERHRKKKRKVILYYILSTLCYSRIN